VAHQPTYRQRTANTSVASLPTIMGRVSQAAIKWWASHTTLHLLSQNFIAPFGVGVGLA